MFYVEIFSNEKYFMPKQAEAKSFFSPLEGEFLSVYCIVINSIPLLLLLLLLLLLFSYQTLGHSIFFVM